METQRPIVHPPAEPKAQVFFHCILFVSLFLRDHMFGGGERQRRPYEGPELQDSEAGASVDAFSVIALGTSDVDKVYINFRY